MMLENEPLTQLARDLLRCDAGPFDVDALLWILRRVGQRDSLTLAAELITRALAVYDKEHKPWVGDPASTVCYSDMCNPAVNGCSHNFGGGAVVKHVVANGWEVIGTDGDGVYDRTTAERIARKTATLRRLAERLAAISRAEENALCAAGGRRR